MRLLGHFLTFLIAITVAGTGGYYFLQQNYAKQLEMEKLRTSLLSMKNEINRLQSSLVTQQDMIERNSSQLNQQLAFYTKDMKRLASKLNKWQETSAQELKKITEALTSFQKENNVELTTLKEKNRIDLQNLLAQTKADVHNARKDYIKIIKSLQNQIILMTHRYVKKNELSRLFNKALNSFVTRHEFVNADLGSLPSGRPGKIIKAIPTSIPNEAREILVYAFIATNYVRGGRHSFKISVKLNESKEAAFYLYSIAQMQQEWSYNSDNFWLPMPANRKIFLETTGSALFGSWESRVKIVAYR
jgi:hypothetical protein